MREEGDSGGVTTLAILFFVDTFTECAKEGECNKHDSSEEFQSFERYHRFLRNMRFRCIRWVGGVCLCQRVSEEIGGGSGGFDAWVLWLRMPFMDDFHRIPMSCWHILARHYDS